MDQNKSHKQILKSTGIIGGAQIISILIGIIRTKAIALLLGPAGVGIIGNLQAIIDLMRQSTGFGINFSAVKDIAEARNSEDEGRIARTIAIVRYWALGTGILGMLATIVLCMPLSSYSFNNEHYALSIAIISVTLLFTSVMGGQLAILQGLRQIKSMAAATLYGSLLSTMITLPFYWWLGIDGIVPGMIFTAVGGVLISCWYVRKIKVEKNKLSISETLRIGWEMARLGFFIVITGFMATATMYVVRGFIVKEMDLDAVGYFQAAWMIANMYLGIVLNAMLADFFPALSSISSDNKASNKLINEQLEMALVVGAPLLISLIACSAIVIKVLYSSSFMLAVPILQWQIAGTFIVLIMWPLGVMFLSKGKGIFCIITDGIWSMAYLLFVFLGWNFFGLNVLGIAYVVACVVKLVIVLISVRKLGRFSFSLINLRYITFFGIITLLTLANVLFFQDYLQYVISGMLMIVSLSYSYFIISNIINIKQIIRAKICRK